MAVELQPLVLESSLTMQKILEAEDHKARCRLIKYFIEAEVTRLSTKKSLQGLFSSSGGSDDVSTTDTSSSIPPEEMISQEKKDSKSPTFFDEPDAFQ